MAAPMNMVVANDLTVCGSPYPIEIASGATMVAVAASRRVLSRNATRRRPTRALRSMRAASAIRNGCAISSRDPSARRQEALETRDQVGPREEHHAVALAHRPWSRRG